MCRSPKEVLNKLEKEIEQTDIHNESVQAGVIQEPLTPQQGPQSLSLTVAHFDDDGNDFFFMVTNTKYNIWVRLQFIDVVNK